MKVMENGIYYTTKEAAELINCHKNTVHNWCMDGFMEFIEVGEAQWKYIHEDVVKDFKEKVEKEKGKRELFNRRRDSIRERVRKAKEEEKKVEKEENFIVYKRGVL